MDEFSEYELHSPESFLQEGLDMLESDHFDEALQAFESVLALQPCNPDALFHRGVTLIKLGKLTEAIKSFECAIALAPTEASFHSHCGYALLMDGKPDAALERFEHALRLQPDSYENKVYKACVMAENRKLGEARVLLEEVLLEHPEDPEVIRHYANVLSALGEDHDALHYYSVLLKRDANNLEAINRRGMLFLRQGNRPEAIKCFREYVALNPSDTAIWVILLETLTEMDLTATVIATAGDAVSSGIENCDVYQLRGRALLEDRQYDDAIVDLRRARTLDDRNIEIHFLLARAYADRGRLKHSLLSINRALQLSPRDQRLLYMKARLYHELDDPEQELLALNNLSGLSPDDFRVLEMQAANLGGANRFDESLVLLIRFLEKHPQHRRALQLCAEAFEQVGDIEGARRQFRTLFSLRPVSARTYRDYAGFLLRQSEKKDAAVVLDRAVEDYPKDAGVQTLRAVVYQMLERHRSCIINLNAFLDTGSAPPEANWLLGKSWYALENYAMALASFQRARVNGAQSTAFSDVPEFKCLVAEAYSLHHLGRTTEGIFLLEQHGRRFTAFAREFHEVLAELYNHVCAYAKACAVAVEGLKGSPESPVLHYRLARCSAALGRKSTALRHLDAAIQLDPRLVSIAIHDGRFQKYALSFRMNRLVNFYFLKRRAEFLAIILMALAAAFAAMLWLR